MLRGGPYFQAILDFAYLFFSFFIKASTKWENELQKELKVWSNLFSTNFNIKYIEVKYLHQNQISKRQE